MLADHARRVVVNEFKDQHRREAAADTLERGDEDRNKVKGYRVFGKVRGQSRGEKRERELTETYKRDKEQGKTPRRR